ncbi:N4-gp56 family major capsid protein [Streptomyces sp. NPDC007083]|uniref:phage major capsid protein n=1 Tax=Streptomyces sp. NPDC007083 TaxID=3156913 RepID=UPI0033EC0DFF
MALTNFIPAVYAASTLTALDTALAYGSAGVTNRDYEGDVSEFGGSVVINTVADPTVEAYTAYTDMVGGNAATSPQTMLIDQKRAWSLNIDDVDRAQARDDADFVSKVSQKAAHLLAKTADAYIAAQMAAAVTPGAEVTLSTPEAAYDLLVDMRTDLSEQDVPVDGRWVVVTPAFHGLLLKDPRFVSSGDAQGGLTRSSGVVGQAAGFTVLESNQAPAGPGAGAGRLILAGHALATTYADQVSKVEAIRHPKQFVDVLRGLHVYGAKVVKPEALAARDVVIG